MPFPEVKRVIYRKNPLDQVVCQLRFPPILKIDAGIPADFQERIRRDFPNYSETSEWKVEFSPKIKGQIPQEVLTQILQSSRGKNYEFSSEDGFWKINLTRTFIALTANKYERWEKFKEKLAIPFNAFIEIYSPDHFSRIGLRYIDVIRRSILNLNGVNWTELLQPYILGILSVPEMVNVVHKCENRYEIGLSDGESIVRIITSFVEAADNGEICYMIDSDFYNTNKTRLDDTMKKLDYFNMRASRLIQWCITNRLHQTMEPQTL
jgi:uncharacterized protein (TIGR04255 family)